MAIDYQQVLAKSPNPYVLLDRELDIVWANEAYLTVTSRTLDDIAGRNMFEAFPSKGEAHRQLADSFSRVLKTGEPDEIAHIRYDIPNPVGGFDVHVWSATHTPLHGEDGNVELILQHTVRITELESNGSPRNAAGVARRAEVVEQRFQGASRQLERFRAMLEQAPGFVAVLAGEEHRFVMANAAYRELVGNRSLVGRTVARALPEVVDQGFVDILDEVLESGQPYFGKQERVVLKRPETGELESRYLEFIYQPVIGEDGFRGILVQGHDVSEEVAAEEQQRLLINELNHRVKNTLAVVQGIAQQTFRDMRDSEERQIFSDRLGALANAHNLLTERNWETADLATIVRSGISATAPTREDDIAFSGPPVLLQPQPAVALAMVIHELSTNAIKYGALSSPQGRIDISWTISNDDDGTARLTFTWTESGGPLVGNPSDKGFGTRLIARGLGTPGGEARLEYRPEGLHYRLEAVL